jgi:hypothetical protein
MSTLTQTECKVVRECLAAAADGPFFPDWEFHSLFGLNRDELRNVLSLWPDVDQKSVVTQLAINNTLNNLLGYPHGQDPAWDHFISAPPAEVSRIFYKWRGEAAPIEMDSKANRRRSY